METLTLNDGTVLTGHILENGDGQSIFVYLDGMSIVQGFTLFIDPDKTAEITAENHGESHVYTGFTTLWSISNEYGNCNIVMRKGDANV